MSDLISRETVIDILKQTGIIQNNDIGHLVIEEINRIPMAYDIDKVVEELEEKARPVNAIGYKAIKKDVAIKIVKQGGVDDD